MKLKKIASLALAGIMAVSMLAGCKDGGNGGENGGTGELTPSSTYTSTVMSSADATTQALFKVGASSQLDGAVSYVAANFTYQNASDKSTLTTIMDNSQEMRNLAKKYMSNAVYATGDLTTDDAYITGTAIKQLVGQKDVTVYTMFAVSRKYNDEYVDNLVTKKVNAIAVALSDNIPDDGNTYNYTINVSKANSQKSKNEANVDNDAVIVAIAITLDYTEASFNA